MILEIDMGNTRIKWRLRQVSSYLLRGVFFARDGFEQMSLSLHPFQDAIERVLVASVVSSEVENKLLEWSARALGIKAELAQTQSNYGGVVNGYEVPGALGVDRWLASVAAYQKFKRACVIVSCGTAITVDLIAADGRHLGGYIVPGLSLLTQALNLKTQKVKVSGLGEGWTLRPGVNTQSAVDGGCAAMLQGLIDNALKQLRVTENDADVVLLLTGGDAQKVQGLYPQAFLVPDLVMDGLVIVSK